MSIMAGGSPVTALYAGAVKVYPVEADLSDLRIAWDDENMLAVDYAAASLVSDFPVAANMRVEAQADAVLLKWDAFDDSVTWTWPAGQYALVPTPGVGVYAATVKMPFAIARPMVADDRGYKTGGAIEGTASDFSGFVLNAPLYPESDEMPYAPNRPQMISGIVIAPAAAMNAPAQNFQIPALIPVLKGTNLRLISKAVVSGWNSVGLTGCPLKYVVTGGTPITVNPGTTELQTTQIHYEAGQMRFSRCSMTSQVIEEWPGGLPPMPSLTDVNVFSMSLSDSEAIGVAGGSAPVLPSSIPAGAPIYVYYQIGPSFQTRTWQRWVWPIRVAGDGQAQAQTAPTGWPLVNPFPSGYTGTVYLGHPSNPETPGVDPPWADPNGTTLNHGPITVT